ncbi:transcription factor bHLH162-like [Cucurbita maxima]|uniref:Transcription factor bHLH162-like n=1 Tax=Cucurbita maxima TaxID=3661 RepID=A0A6J1JF05_CUCMA|nr:transcription factor bHLH162-like [Cucurbita maxima]
MKSLYSKLNSLLPTHHSNEMPLSVSDQIEEAIKYIKSLELKLKKNEEKKERFTRQSSSSLYTAPTRSRNRNGPELRIKEIGSAVEVVLSIGLEEDRFIFYEIIHIFYQERAEIVNVSYSVVGNSVLYSLHAEIEDVVYEFGATKPTERIKRLVYGWANDGEMKAAGSSSSFGGSRRPGNGPSTCSDNQF